MPAWFDLRSLDPNGEEDEPGINKSRDTIESIIEAELKSGIPENRVMLGGFSQGGALALYTGLTSRFKLGGIVALSCWLPLHKKFPSMMKNPEICILQCHGDCDPVVPFKWGQLTSSLLRNLIPHHEWLNYRGLGHSSSEEEMKDVKRKLEELLQN